MNQMLPIVKTFTEYLLDERHFSQYTSRCYGADLRQYVEYLEETLGEPANETAEAAGLRSRQSWQRYRDRPDLGGRHGSHPSLLGDSGRTGILARDHGEKNRDPPLVPPLVGKERVATRQPHVVDPHPKTRKAIAKSCGSRADRTVALDPRHHQLARCSRSSHLGNLVFHGPPRQRTGGHQSRRSECGSTRDCGAGQGTQRATGAPGLSRDRRHSGLS